MKKILSTILILTFILMLTACGKAETKSPQDYGNEYDADGFYLNSHEAEIGEHDKLTIYLSPDDFSIEDMIDRYNMYCSQNSEDSFTIDKIKFDTVEEFEEKFSTEVMAGKGPDLMFTSQLIPFEKIVRSGKLLDIDELMKDTKLDFSDFNRVVMDAGIFDGTRYFVPFAFKPRCMAAEKERLEEFNFPINQGYNLTYDDPAFVNFVSNSKNHVWFYGDYKDDDFLPNTVYLYNLVNDYVDLKSGKVELDSKKFSESVDTVAKLLHLSDGVDEDRSYENYLFSDNVCDPFALAAQIYCTDLVDEKYTVFSREKAETNILYKGLSRNKTDNRAVAEFAVAVNASTKLPEKAREFIKYQLSDAWQRVYIETDEEKREGDIVFPVKAKIFKEDIENARNTKDDKGDKIGINNPFMKAYIDAVKSINKCDIYYTALSSYYGQKIIKKPIEEFLSGKITKKKLISELKRKTELYLNE